MTTEDLTNDTTIAEADRANAIQEYDDAWEEDADPAPDEDNPSLTDTDNDDNPALDQPAPDDPNVDPDTVKAGGDDEVTDPDELQRKKSWEGRLAAREAELKTRSDKLKKAESEYAAEKAERAKKIEEALASGDDDTDWDAVADSLEFPEIAKLGKAMQGLTAAQREQNAQLRADVEHTTLINDTQQEDDLAAQRAAHFNAIEERHPDWRAQIASPEFEQWQASLTPAEQADMQARRQAGNAVQVVDMFDRFKSSQTSRPRPTAADLGGVRRRASVPHAEVDKNDYDAGWDEDD